MFAVLALWIR